MKLTSLAAASSLCALSIACGSAPKTATPSSSASSIATSTSAAHGVTSADRKAALETLGTLTKAANAFSLAIGRCPTSIDELVHAPNGASFAASAPNDPWGHPIAFLAASPDNPTSALVSAGPDGQLLSDDDISLPIQCDQR